MKSFSIALRLLRSRHAALLAPGHVRVSVRGLHLSRNEQRPFSGTVRRPADNGLLFKKYSLPKGDAASADAIMDVTRDAAGPPAKKTAYIALGSNMGDRIAWIERACNEMDARGIKVKRTSSLWETEPMYVLDQDRFVNGACEVSFSPPGVAVRLTWTRLRLPWSRSSCWTPSRTLRNLLGARRLSIKAPETST